MLPFPLLKKGVIKLKSKEEIIKEYELWDLSVDEAEKHLEFEEDGLKEEYGE